jgi:undecaprenyl-diphosphatase
VQTLFSTSACQPPVFPEPRWLNARFAVHRYPWESLFFDIADPGAPGRGVRRIRVPPLVTCEGVKGDNRFILLLSTAAFLVCSAAAGAGLLRPLDVLLLDLARRTDSRVLDGIGMVTSVVGGVEFVAVATVALAAGLLFDGRGRLALRLVVALLVTGLIELAAKTVVPQAPVPEGAMRAPDPSLLEVSTPYPFPSGHMLRSVLLIGAIYALWPNRPARIALLFFLAASATCRVYLGTHWPSDVIGGTLLGIAGLAWTFERQSAKSALDRPEQRNDLTS